MKRNEVSVKDPNEAISDSLFKVLRQYDEKMRNSISARNLWRKKFDNQGMGDLRKIAARSTLFGFLEAEDPLIAEIRKVVNERKARVPEGGDPLTKQVFEYLEERLKYLEQKQRRTPQELTADYKILLVGDGWVHRSDTDNPTVKKLNESLQSTNSEERAWALSRKRACNLKNREYMPEQVYTVDHTAAQLPDLTSDVKEIKQYLPEKQFDFIYFEGFALLTQEDTTDALKAVLPSLKDEGLILYATPKPTGSIILMAKSGEITQEKLDKIPQCVKNSINTELLAAGYLTLEEAIQTHENALVLTDETRQVNRIQI